MTALLATYACSLLHFSVERVDLKTWNVRLNFDFKFWLPRKSIRAMERLIDICIYVIASVFSFQSEKKLLC